MFFWRYRYRLLTFVLISILLFSSLPGTTLWWREAFNAGHTILFVFVSILLYRSLSTKWPLQRRFVIFSLVLATGMLLGVVIEVVQSLFGRETSLLDLKGNLFGLLTGLCLIELLRIKESTRQNLPKAAYLILLSAFFLSGLSPLIKLSWHYTEKINAFPVVFDLTEDWSYSFIRLEDVVLEGVVSADPKHAPYFFRVRFGSGRSAGISIIEPEPDWTRYDSLRFSVLSRQSENIRLVIRVHDKAHDQDMLDRYNKSLLIRPGHNVINIALDEIRDAPASRKLDMKNIAGIVLFSGQKDEPFSVDMSRLYLE